MKLRLRLTMLHFKLIFQKLNKWYTWHKIQFILGLIQQKENKNIIEEIICL